MAAAGRAVAATVATAVLFVAWRHGPDRWRSIYARLQQRVLRCVRMTSSFRLLRSGCVCRIISERLEAEEVLRRWLDGALSGRLLPVFGLDVEWVRDRPASLLQLSCGSECLLLRLCHMGSPPPSLQQLLHEDRVLKVGVGVHHDLERLDSWLRAAASRDRSPSTSLPSRGGLDVAPLALSVCGRDGVCLSQIAWRVLGVRVHKAAHVRCSDWEQPTLSRAQAEYAAEDANLPLQVLRELHRQADSPLGLFRWAAEASQRQACARAAGVARRQARSVSREARGGVEGDAQSGRNVRWGRKSGYGAGAGADSGGGALTRGGSLQGTRSCGTGATEPRKPFGHAPRSAPLYDGWLMLSPQGDTMARLNESRARWYARRGLATLDEQQRSITLTFRPAGLGNAAEPWLVQPKANACVGCGVDQAEASVSGKRTGVSGLGRGTEASASGTRDGQGRDVKTGPTGCEGKAMLEGAVKPEGGAMTERSWPREYDTALPVAAGLIRWSVLPHSMRRLLPEDHKAHDSHDIVLLCGACHRRVEAPYARWRREIMAAHEIPLDTARYVQDPQVAQVSRDVVTERAEPRAARSLPHRPSGSRVKVRSASRFAAGRAGSQSKNRREWEGFGRTEVEGFAHTMAFLGWHVSSLISLAHLAFASLSSLTFFITSLCFLSHLSSSSQLALVLPPRSSLPPPRYSTNAPGCRSHGALSWKAWCARTSSPPGRPAPSTTLPRLPIASSVTRRYRQPRPSTRAWSVPGTSHPRRRWCACSLHRATRRCAAWPSRRAVSSWTRSRRGTCLSAGRSRGATEGRNRHGRPPNRAAGARAAARASICIRATKNYCGAGWHAKSLNAAPGAVC